MANVITNIQPALDFLPPDFNPGVRKLCEAVVPFWIRFKTPIADIQADQVERLVDLYQQFEAGKIRFLMAFRHPDPDDPLCMSQLLWRFVPTIAKQQGISLSDPVHAHFMYDRGIPLWAGNYVTWLFPRLGGSSILRGKVDRLGLKSARELFVNGQFPMAAAPEGATNGHNQNISSLEPGIAQLGFWCVEDLQKMGRSEDVYIVPIGIQYSYLQENWNALEKLISQMEIDCGIPLSSEESTSLSLYNRLTRLGNYLIEIMEEFYQKFYHCQIPIDETLDLKGRLKRLLDVALKVAEDFFEIKPIGDLATRCRRIEQAGWDCIYRDNLQDPDHWSTVKRGLADQVAIEASLKMWHMRLVESFVGVTGQYIQSNPTFDRFAETTIIVWTMITRLKGGNPIKRPYLGKQRVKMTVGEPLCVSQNWQTYKLNRRQAVSDLTQELQKSLEALIHD